MSSLVLIYCEDVGAACAEFFRVAKRSGRLIVVLTHPYFYRTGEALPDGSYVVERDLSRPDSFELNINESVGPFTYYYRPLPAYLNSLVGAGWELRQVRDWFIPWSEYDERTSAQEAVAGLRRTGRVPLFTFFECRKSQAL